MMSDPTTVDRTTVDELTGKLVLLIEESRAWRETDLMHRQLAAKVKTYVRYARSQKFTEDHGRQAQGAIVRIVCGEPPGQASLQFFQRVAHELSKHGLQFEHQLGEDGFPEAVTPRLDATSPPQKPRATSAARPTPARPTPAPPTPAPTAGPPPVPPPRAPAPPQPRPPTAPPAAPPPPARPQPQRPAADVPPLPEVPPAPAPPPPDPWAEDAPAEPTASPPPAAEPSEPTLPEDLEFEPAFPGALGDLEYEPAAGGAPGGLEFEPAFPSGQDDTDAGTEPAASDLERLIEGGDEAVEFIGGAAELEPAAGRPPEPRPGGEATYPPFFPEEEFGRALPDVDEIASMGLGAEATTAVIETASGKKIRLDKASALDDAIAAAVPAEQGPSLLRAIGAAILGALAGAIVWILLAIPAATGASPLALAVAVMVGFNVRLRGAGHTMPFRVVGILGTFLGSALGSIGAAVALSAMEAGTQVAGVLEILSNTDAVLAAFTSRYSLLDLLSLFLASYIAFRISASKPS